MTKSTLDRDGQKRLAEVLKIANGDLEAVRSAVIRALYGETEHGRRVYLYNELTRRAKRSIRAKKRKVVTEKHDSHIFSFRITPYTLRDAENHELALIRDIPEHDL
jgi:hypothetical protein